MKWLWFSRSAIFFATNHHYSCAPARRSVYAGDLQEKKLGIFAATKLGSWLHDGCGACCNSEADHVSQRIATGKGKADTV